MAEWPAEGERKSKEGIYERRLRKLQILFEQQAKTLEEERTWRKAAVEKLDQTVAEKQSLELKYERKNASKDRIEADKERIEAERKADKERFEAERKADEEWIEAARKEDKERFKADKERFEAYRERIEAARKADRERFDAERKQSAKSLDLVRKEKITFKHRLELLELDRFINKPSIAKTVLSDAVKAAVSELWTLSWRPEKPSEAIVFDSTRLAISIFARAARI